jgi:hypothetical protein
LAIGYSRNGERGLTRAITVENSEAGGRVKDPVNARRDLSTVLCCWDSRVKAVVGEGEEKVRGWLSLE